MQAILMCIGCLVVLALAGLAGAPDKADAGTYAVRQCDHEAGITTASFVWESSGLPAPAPHANSGCSEFGLGIRNGDPGSVRHYADGAYGGYVVASPAGTVFTRFSALFGTFQACCVAGMEAVLVAHEATDGDGLTDQAFRGFLPAASWATPSGAEGPVSLTWQRTNFDARRIGYFLSCGASSGCSQSSTGDTRVRARAFDFTLDDQHDPVIDDLGGSLISGGWLSGTQTLTASLSDLGGGIQRVSATLDGASILNSPSSCSEFDGRYIELRPCPLARNGTWTVAGPLADDGPATLRVRVDDVGGNSSHFQTPVQIDNAAPAAPSGVSLEGSAAWRAQPDFVVKWDLEEEQHAPIVRAHYRVCAIQSGPCTDGEQASGEDRRVHVSVPGAGQYSLRVWLEDAAGNVNPGASSTPVQLMFDDGAPGRARVDGPRGWVNGAQASALTLGLDLEGGAETPPSQVAGYSVTSHGGDPDGSVEVPGSPGNYRVPDLPEGQTVIKARAVSGAGVASTAVGSALVKVDRTAPSVVVRDLPVGTPWLREPVHVGLASADQEGLAGVTGAPIDRPTTDGGYIEFRLNGESARLVRGDSATVPITTDGHHELTYRAFDAAGNGSVEKEAVVRIDGTAPVGRFRALDPGDPRRLEVEVSDATSGVAEGRIEYRKVGEREFGTLPTTLGSGVLAARIDDEALPAGRYELRAVVTDVAGNEAVVERWADGASATLALPLRSATRIEVTGETVTKLCKKAGGKQRKRRPACRRVTKRGTTLAPGFGTRATTAGRVTSANGTPVGGAPVAIEGQPRSGGEYAPLGTARTDAQGNFRFSLPAGPSRTVRYRYAGTDTALPVTAALTTKVPAAARLKVNRRRLRNGQTVRFAGKLLGRPIPAAGKVVALQAKVGRRWRTFANPRANAKGAFRHRYRFTSTTGVRRYAFRAVVAREAAYPYERGSSPTVRVTVRGR